MARKDKLLITKLAQEPFFIRCADNLREGDVQVASITSIVWARLERRVTTDPEKWEIEIPYSGGFANLQILDDGDFADAMIAGEINADLDDDPPPGDDYVLVVKCTVTFTSEYGGNTTGKVFRREARIAYGSVTAPYSA